MTQPFKHLSPSHVNDWIERRSKWFAHRVMGAEFPASPDMHRGTAVEVGIASMCFVRPVPSLELAIEDALASFDIDMSGEVVDLRDSIPELVKVGIGEMQKLFKEHGPVVGYQRPVENKLFHDGYPWLGFIDFAFEDGTILDVKVSKQTKTEIPAGWGRQGAYYRYDSEKPVKFLALTALKTKTTGTVLTLSDEEYTTYLNQLRDAERAIATVMNLGPERLAACFVPDFGDFTWKSPETQQIARQIWQ